MASSSGNSINYWRLFAQLRSYLAKSYPSVVSENLYNDIANIVRLISKESISHNNQNAANPKPKAREIVPSSKVVQKTEVSNQRENDQKSVLTTLNSYIPNLSPTLSLRDPEPNSPAVKNGKKSLPKWMLKKKDTVSRVSIDNRTRHLVTGLKAGQSIHVTARRLEDLCTHLRAFPDTRGVAIKCAGVSRILRLLHSVEDVVTQETARQALAMLGYVEPVEGHGIKILSIDGGGTRGLIAIDMLRHLERRTGRRICDLFDFVCGVSTGAVLAVLIAAHRQPLDECEKLYLTISNQIFSQTTFKGTASLVWKNSYYDSDAWTEILRVHMGDIPLIETSKIENMKKLCLVSTQCNNNWVKAFVFRNYTFPYRVASHFSGSSSARLWEAVRASAAAPGYFSEFRLQELILLDGGVMVNNPTAIAIHEARKLWPDTPLQSVVSLGTGRHEPLAVEGDKSINWASRLRTIINSATDTEGVHTTLHDLLPGNVYFRFNPYLSEEIALDEIREEKLAAMMEDASLYIRKNETKLSGAVESLMRRKGIVDKALDYLTLRKEIWF